MRKPKYAIGFIILVLVVGVYSIVYFKLIGSPHKGNNVTVVLKSMNVRLDFWQAVSNGAEAAAKEMGLELVVQGPLQEGDADDQILILEDAIDRKPDAIVVAPIMDDRMPAMLDKIRSSGIELIVIDTPVDMNPAPVVVSNDHEEAGRLAGQTAIDEAKGRPTVAIIGDSADSRISAERLTGLKQAMLPYKDSLIGMYYADNSEEQAYEVAKRLLAEDNPFNTLIALNESATLGAAKALKERNKSGVINLIGFDSSVDEIQLLEAGVVKAAIVQKPFNMGYLGVKTALKLIHGGDAESITYIESNLITKENMYSPENQKLLFPFINNR
ncbi:substrate-binding domain-containing protein [Cohnella lupini]|uniref:Monosaccharide ABC transporter substrate-binding protein (CUT2 family) n=1 Tax=Cohnella lupini TaxID=1294267 RepID=A0A3D9IQP4_9BACL|nr:substrate-binding domain-containing protein [Cohnella lupini]RED64007.1 monosaccharide ABC transporter substrate-binding protein (CUT2 family) [Cohnella lupini]